MITQDRRIRRRIRRARAVAAAVAAALAATAAAPGAAGAQGEPDFSQCPLANPAVGSCFIARITGGQFKIGNATVPVDRTITLQGGVITDPETGETEFVEAANGQTLSRTPLVVPGGLLGLAPPAWVPQPIRGVLQEAIDLFNEVTATAELVGPVGFSFNNFANLEGPAITLPLRVTLSNPFLGPSCRIGSRRQPIVLRLTAGTTSPPPPARPITGNPGDVTFEHAGQLIRSRGFELVDNAFAAPAADGCGGLLFSWAIDPVVNLKEGLPAAAGANEARQIGEFALGDRRFAE
mgnify:CR=1 FL=1